MFFFFMCFVILNLSGLLRPATCGVRSPTKGSPPPSTTFAAGGIHSVASLFEKLQVSEEGGRVPSLLTLMGLDSEKLLAHAFDGVISVIFLISQVLTKDVNVGRRRKTRTDSSLFRFLFTRQQVIGLSSQMQDPDIVDLLLAEIEERTKERPPEETECAKLLLCKVTPFVRGMQRSLGFFAGRERKKEERVDESGRGAEQSSCRRAGRTRCPSGDERGSATAEEALWQQTNIRDRIYFFAPTLDEVIEFGGDCDKRFPRCSY